MILVTATHPQWCLCGGLQRVQLQLPGTRVVIVADCPHCLPPHIPILSTGEKS